TENLVRQFHQLRIADLAFAVHEETTYCPTFLSVTNCLYGVFRTRHDGGNEDGHQCDRTRRAHPFGVGIVTCGARAPPAARESLHLPRSAESGSPQLTVVLAATGRIDDLDVPTRHVPIGELGPLSPAGVAD